MKQFYWIGAALILTACGNHSEMSHSEKPATGMAHDMDHAKAQGIEISNGFVRPPLPGRDIAAGFFSVTNHGADDRLISATSPISENVEIHTHTNDNGVMKMRQVSGVDLLAGETVEFKPGSFHLMMYAADINENTEDVAVTLNYEKADSVTLILPLGEPNMGGHSGH
jgi:copper(I)-binding protein